MIPGNHWEQQALAILRTEAPERYRTLAGEAGDLQAVISAAAEAAIASYGTMVGDEGMNADAAREIAIDQMREELIGHRSV